MKNEIWVTFVFLAGCPGFGSQKGFLYGTVPECVNYEDHISQLIDYYCITCHNEGSSWPLSTYDEVRRYSAIDGSSNDIFTRITDVSAPMPPRNNSPMLAEAEVTMFEEWMDLDFPETSIDVPSCGTNP